MPAYRVTIDAKNFLVEFDGRLDKYGFITYRLVNAETPQDAELMAVEMLRKDSELRALVKNRPDDRPVMDITEVAMLHDLDDEVEQPGRVWYEMNPKRWWQLWR